MDTAAATDLSPKQFAAATGLSLRTVLRRLGYFTRIVTGKPVPARLRLLAIPYRFRLGIPYRIPAEVLPLFLDSTGPNKAATTP